MYSKGRTGLAFVACAVFLGTKVCADEQPRDISTVWIYQDVASQNDQRSETERMFEPYGIMPAERAARVAVDTSHLLETEDRGKGTAVEVIMLFDRPTDWEGAYWLLENGTAWGSQRGINVQALMGVDPHMKLALRFQAWGNGRVSFKCGGVNAGQFPSSLRLPIEVDGVPITLTNDAKEYTIGPFEARQLTNIIDPLCVVASALDQRGADARQVRVFIDNVRFEHFKPRVAARAANWRERLLNTMFLCYTPTGFDPTARPIKRPKPDDIRQDLERIRRLAIDSGVPISQIGITTYGCDNGIELVPRIAKEMGIAVLVGIFNPKNKEEVRNCKAILADSDLNDTIVAVVVGNETLTFRRGTLDDIEAVIKELRSVRDVPFTTTEIIQSYGNRRLFDMCDLTLVNAHGIFAGKLDAYDCAKWTTVQVAALCDAAPANHPVLIREVGFPSAPKPFTGEQQRLFWTTVLGDEVANRSNFFFFDGLTVAWKHELVSIPGKGEVNIGPHWSVLFDEDGVTKPFAKELIKLWHSSRSQ